MHNDELNKHRSIVVLSFVAFVCSFIALALLLCRLASLFTHRYLLLFLLPSIALLIILGIAAFFRFFPIESALKARHLASIIENQ